MKRTGLLAAFAMLLLTLSACVVEPYGERERGEHYHDDGHRVWRGE